MIKKILEHCQKGSNGVGFNDVVLMLYNSVATAEVSMDMDDVRFTDDGLGWTHRYGGSSDGILLELLDKDGNVNGETTLREADILSMARALQKAHKM